MTDGIFSERRGIAAFLLGCAGVTAGVILHLPMFIASAPMHYRLAGMPMDAGMLFGMAAIIGGVIVASYGLLPVKLNAGSPSAAAIITVAAPEDAALGPAHWRLMVVLVVALTIDVMKPATLGFTMTGMEGEYGVSAAHAALVPFSAIAGTVTGSVVWGAIADLYGRKASILLSAVMFVGTSICGAMPSLEWNIFMCFLMGLAAGGMLPVTYALLAETMPVRHRGWALVLVGGLGAVAGYVAASGASALLQPIFGWRILWLLNLPTGLLLVALGALFPESPAYLIARGRRREAQRIMQAFGAHAEVKRATPAAPSHQQAMPKSMTGKLIALSLTALAWGLINFGLILWLPADLVARGYSVEIASALLAKSALIALPMVFVAAFLYSRWSTKRTLVAMIVLTMVGLVGILWLAWIGGSPVLPVALLILGINGVIATLLPYTAESFPLRVRGRATGWVAACSKGGGLVAQLLGVLALEPELADAALLMLAPLAVALVLVIRFGRETRGRDLRSLDLSTAASP